MVGTAEDFRHLRSVAAEHGADSRLGRQPGAGQQPTEARGFVIYVGMDEIMASAAGTSLTRLANELRHYVESLVPGAESQRGIELLRGHD